MSGDPYIKENEELRAEIARLRLNYKEMCDCAETWEAEAEQLQNVIKDQRAQLDKLGDRFDAQSDEIARLRAALEEIVRNGDQGIHVPGPYDIAKAALAKEGE